MNDSLRGSLRFRFAATLLLAALAAPCGQAQVSPEQQADMLLDAGRRAYNEKNYPFAVTRLREFLQRFAGNKNAPLARYSLALALLDGADKDYQGAVENLQPLAGNKDMAEHAHVLYYLGLARRGLGLRELAQATAKPQEAVQRRQTANQRFDEAARDFAAAIAVFAARVTDVPADAKELPVDLEWAARARCEQAEMLLRTLKAKEAQAVVAPFLTDRTLGKSRYRTLAIYEYGFASFLLNDLNAAGRSLSLEGVGTDAEFGPHARYLLGRVHHLQDERAEAALQYEGAINDFGKQKQAATEALKQGDRFKNDPEEKARLEALVKGPPPDHVARAALYLGVLQYEDGRFADALARWTAFVQQQPQSPLAAEAELRRGFCQVQLKQWAEAAKTLQPLIDKEPRLNDQALLWLAKSQAGAAGDVQNNPQAQAAGYQTAIATFRRAAERAAQLAATDPEAKTRRGEIFLELGDVQQIANLHKDASGSYNQVLNDKLLPQREEEVLKRLAAALHLAGDYGESDKVCQRFQQAYPKSPLLPALLFRSAENAYFQALAAEKNPNLPNRVAELARLNDEVVKRYRAVAEKFPEFQHANLARYGIALGLYRKGDIEKAREALEAIPAPERSGDLAPASYLLADCLIRLAPTKADDALAAGRMEEQLKAASELLEGFVASNPQGPQAADALLKLGLCQQRLASLLAQPPERAKMLGTARASYERLIQQFAKSELMPQAVLERAKVLAAAGDTNGAINELRRFTNDPLKAAPVAPMALLELANLLRATNRAAEAAEVLDKARQQYEASLAKDPARADWVALLRYHHGVALREANKRPEARTALDLVVKQAANRPEGAEAALRWARCLKEESEVKIDAARKRLAGNLKPEETTAANKDLEAGLKDLRDAAAFLEAQAEQLKQKLPDREVRARMHYDAAWAYRLLADHEIDLARAKVQKDQWDKLKAEVAKLTPAGRTPLPVAAPDVPLSAVPPQPGEQRVRAQYQALIAAFPDLPLATDARLELAEVMSGRGEHDPAVKLLREALDKEPSPETTDRVRLRLGACLAAKGDHKAALAQFRVVAGNPKSTVVAQGHYRAGECLMQTKEWAEAIKHLAVFRDQGPFQNLPGLTDRALLRLGHALAQLGQWDASKQAHEQVAARFANGPWVHEARYGMGWAWQNLKQYDQAATAYGQVVAGTVTELAARAQLQIGLCRMEQKRFPEAATALLVVPYTYDYPEWSAAALFEAHRPLTEMKQPEQAERLLRRLIKDHPESKWAQAARERLTGKE